MPRGIPTLVKPWTRINWLKLNRGQQLFAVQEWQSYLARTGQAIPDLPNDVAILLKVPESYISKKAQNILSSLWTDGAEGTEQQHRAEETITSASAGSEESEGEAESASRDDRDEDSSPFLGFEQDGATLLDGYQRLLEVINELNASYGDEAPPVLRPQRQRVRTSAAADQSIPDLSLHVDSQPSASEHISGSSPGAQDLENTEAIEQLTLPEIPLAYIHELLDSFVDEGEVCFHRCTRKIHIMCSI
jgi:hypothetical protein